MSFFSLKKLSIWPFRKSKTTKKTIVRACTDPIESTLKYEWDIHKFGYMYPNPATSNMCPYVLFKKLKSPSFTIGTENITMPPSKWNIQLICDEEPSSSNNHYMEISLMLEEIDYKSRKINQCVDFFQTVTGSGKDLFAVRCKMYLVDDKEVIIHSETMAKMMSLTKSKCGFLGFTTLEKIWKEKIKYFPDNILRIRVELTIISETTSISDDIRFPPLKMDKLGVDLSNLFESKNLADVTIRCQSKTFHAHKQILSARCTFFEKMFGSNMKEALEPHVVDIVDIDSDICFSFLYYLYTDRVDFLLTDVRKLSALAKVADKYGLEELKDYCFQCLQVEINLSNAGNLAVLAYYYNAEPKIGKHIRQFCHTNWSLLITNTEFRKLILDYPGAFVRNF